MKPVLIILFNHKFERNLPRLRQLYSGRFDNLYFIMPFYTGTEPDVLTVYENSFYFQGYIAQALQQIKHLRFSHYIVIGDDLILDPTIDQHNYAEFFKLDNETGFIPEVFLIHDETTPRTLMRPALHWFWNNNAVQFRIEQKGIEAAGDLPSYDEAIQLLRQHGYDFKPELQKDMLAQNYPRYGDENVDTLKIYLKHVFNVAYGNCKFNSVHRRTMHYPMVASYSDIVIFPGSVAERLGQYCGVLAALNLFVEIAIPTALLLAVKKVTQEKDINKKGLVLWQAEEIKQIENDYQNDLDNLLSHFPNDTLYIHPVKLSRWK